MKESRIKQSSSAYFFLVGCAVLVSLIPILITESLIDARRLGYKLAVFEVSSGWGGRQQITGPILTIPVSQTVRGERGKESVTNLNILPDSLSIMGVVTTQVHDSGAYKVDLYTAHLKISGVCSLDSHHVLGQRNIFPQWDEGFLTLGISDVKGIKGAVNFSFNGAPLLPRAGVQSTDITGSGITLLPCLDPKVKTYFFRCSLTVRGSTELLFTPLGRRTEAALQLSSAKVRFTGAFLPDDQRSDQSGLSAHWTIEELDRNYPQQWVNDRHDVDPSTFGVGFLQTSNEYQEIHRTASSGILVINLMSLALLLCEVLLGEVIHPIHFLLVGLNLALFYLLVLSASEYFGFATAYLLSAIGVLLLVVLYSRTMAVTWKTSLVFGVVLSGLYAYVYAVVQTQNYALILGSLGLLLILAVIMYFTRNVDWFSYGHGCQGYVDDGPSTRGAPVDWATV